MTDLRPAMHSNSETQSARPGEKRVPLSGDVLRRRIYSPRSYAQVRNAAVVPVVHSECDALASWFPLVWRRQESQIEFVALRGLVDDERFQPRSARSLLPLILRAYPFVFDHASTIGPATARMLDDVVADEPTDIGATITTVHHRLSRATQSRFVLMDRFAEDSVPTAEIGRALADMGAFEPWPLRFDIEGHPIQVTDLFVIRRAMFDDGRFAPLLRQYGMNCARMLSLHRVSLFRAGGLLAAARTALRESSEKSVPGAADPVREALGQQSPLAAHSQVAARA
jgi:hypothetical protein